jgi:hypothetical protein
MYNIILKLGFDSYQAEKERAVTDQIKNCKGYMVLVTCPLKKL